MSGNIIISKATNPPGSMQPFTFTIFPPGFWSFVNFNDRNGGLSIVPTDMGWNELGLVSAQWVALIEGSFAGAGGFPTPVYPSFINAQFSSTTGTLTPIPGSPAFQLVPFGGSYSSPPGGAEYADLSGNTTHSPTGSNPPTSAVTGAVTLFVWLPAGVFHFTSFALLGNVFKWNPPAAIQTFTLTDGQNQDSGQLTAGTYSVVEDPVSGWITSPSQDPSAIVVTNGGTVNILFTNTLLSASCIPVGDNGVFVSDLELYIGPATALYNNPLPSAALNFFETTTEGRHAVVLDFNSGGGLYARDLGTIFTWPVQSGTILYVWQPSIIPMPEGIYGRATDWLESGGAKFIQGVIIEADSFNNAKTFMLQDADTLQMHALNEVPATFNQQSVKAFSCVTPFVAHSARVVSSDGVEWRVWTTKLVFQPWPELCFNWETELSSMGMVGWGHIRELNVPYVSTSPVTVNLTFDAWPTITLTLPSTNGLQAKTKVTIPTNKFKLVGFQSVSGQGHRIFADDLQVKIKSWGSTESYQILRPWGGQSRTGAVV